jgi:hypothetical protein
MTKQRDLRIIGRWPHQVYGHHTAQLRSVAVLTLPAPNSTATMRSNLFEVDMSNIFDDARRELEDETIRKNKASAADDHEIP